MGEVTTYSKKETELRALCTKKYKAKKKRYYAPNDADDLSVTFQNCLKECLDYDMVDKHNIKFALHYVYPYISKTTWAHIMKTSPQMKMYSDVDIIVEVSGDVWEIIDQKQKDILLEHELMHLYLNENDEGVLNIQLQGHDLEDFKKIISKYGIEWTEQRELIQAQLEELEEDKKAKEKEEAIKSGKLRRVGRPRKIFSNQ